MLRRIDGAIRDNVTGSMICGGLGGYIVADRSCDQSKSSSTHWDRS